MLIKRIILSLFYFLVYSYMLSILDIGRINRKDAKALSISLRLCGKIVFDQVIINNTKEKKPRTCPDKIGRRRGAEKKKSLA
jgi:hypothetical protein